MEVRARGKRPWCQRVRRSVVLLALLGVSGCVGPNAVRYTRLRYNEVVRDTNDQQLLINIVRLRYADSPVFIDLPNITSQFEVSGRGNYLGGARQPVSWTYEPWARRADPPRLADLELPSPRGTGNRQGALESSLG